MKKVSKSSAQDSTLLPISGHRVERICIDHAVSILFVATDHEATVRIGGRFEVHRSGVRHPVDPENVSSLIPVLSLFGNQVESAVASPEGELALTFRDGCLLSVPPDDEYEAWEYSGTDDTLAVANPGGGLSVWAARA